MSVLHRIKFSTYMNYIKLTVPTRLCCTTSNKKGLVLGIHSKKDSSDVILTSVSEHYNKLTGGKLLEAIHLTGNSVKQGKSFVFWGLDSTYRSVAVVGLGDESQQYNDLEQLDEKKESVRVAASVGYKSLKEAGMTHIDFDDMCDAESAAEGTALAAWLFNAFKTKKKDEVVPPKYELSSVSNNKSEWNRGIIKASAQNLARSLMHTPANFMTPTIFANTAKDYLEKNKVTVNIKDKTWVENKKMGGLLAVARGSEEPLRFLEIVYCGTPDVKPIVLVGKGVTFDSGGISLKPSLNMDLMRADMGGAACVVATIQAVSTLKLPVNIIGLIPLCENMPSGTATKPGDIITTMSGKTVCVDNTDAEGRLILADALTYSKEFDPKFVLDIATLTGAMTVALGNAATGVFTNSNHLWQQLSAAGSVTGDRVWRFPLWKHYDKQISSNPAYDLTNVGTAKGGGSCTAAAFLKHFVPENVDWLHLDMASVMGPKDESKYYAPGIPGRPTRTLIQFIEQLAK